jgi:hypothetical protein
MSNLRPMFNIPCVDVMMSMPGSTKEEPLHCQQRNRA